MEACLVSSLLFYLGLSIGIGGTLVVVLSMRRLCRASFQIADGKLLVHLGRCGRLEIPLGSISSVKIVEKLGPGIRLGGTAVPKLFYSGLFRFRDIGKALVYADRPENLLLVETRDGQRILLGYDAVKLKDLLEQMAGNGPSGETRMIPYSGRYLRIALALYVAAIAVAVAAVALLPAKIMFLGEAMTKGEALMVALILAATGIIDIPVFYALSHDDPTLPLVALPIGLSRLLMVLSVLVAGLTCTAA